ncbi:hypothetical protein LXA43DRAFT_23208 [Ganoderma leucocontextum]|nr:hypothetical protein LXA43DRAFT_23208 [Ganoderma leucocontextum]
MLATSATRNRETEKAIEWLHPLFEFDDVEMPISSRVPTPYFPGSGALFLRRCNDDRGVGRMRWDGLGVPAGGTHGRTEQDYVTDDEWRLPFHGF